MPATKRILLIQGHPDATPGHLCHALQDAYADGAVAAGHEVRQVTVAQLDFPLLRSQEAWERGLLPATLKQAQGDIGWAEHLVLFFPLWMGDMPALTKAFLEQVLRPGFAVFPDASGATGRKGLAGRSARVVVTMFMPALVYKWYFRAHSVKSLERNILGLCGVAPVRETLIGQVGQLGQKDALRQMQKLRALGAAGA
jgi:putative NADPH-quinone reductase